MELLAETRFDFVQPADKAFIHAFDAALTGLGYDCGGTIGNGYCWGRYMLIYTKTGAKSKKVVARIYIRDNGIALRLFLNQIDRHRAYIESAPPHIQEVFIGKHGTCGRCNNDHDGYCKFRKSYTIRDRLIDKCNGITFEFHNPTVEKLDDYLALFTEFYPGKRACRAALTPHPSPNTGRGVSTRSAGVTRGNIPGA